jgi:hypothetical protein
VPKEISEKAASSLNIEIIGWGAGVSKDADCLQSAASSSGSAFASATQLATFKSQ